MAGIDRVTDSTTGSPVIAKLATGKGIGDASLTLTVATNWTTTSKIHFSIYNLTAGGIKDPTTQTDWMGNLTGTTISNLTMTAGPDRVYTTDAYVEMTPTAGYAKDLYDWGTAHADPTTGALLPAAVQAATSAGSIPASALSNVWWEELGRTTLGVAGNALNVSFTAKKYLHVMLNTQATGGTTRAIMRYNSDSGTNYSQRFTFYDGNADAFNVSNAQLNTERGTVASGSILQLDAYITNIQSWAKSGIMHSNTIASSAAIAELPITFWNHWANTSAQISSIQVTNTGTGTFAIGSEIIVLGHN